MNKKFIYYFLAVVVVGILPKTVSFISSQVSKQTSPIACTLEAKLCPDGSSVSRVSPSCEFAQCPSNLTANPSQVQEKANQVALVATTTKSPQATSTITPQKIASQEKNIVPVSTPSLLSRITSSVSSLIHTVAAPLQSNLGQGGGNPNDASIPASSYITNPSTVTSVYKPLPPTNFAGEKYLVKNNNILSNDNKVIYTIPQSVVSAVSSSNPGWTNTIINVVPVGVVPPILNAIPITDLPGKYYLSENSFGNIAACEFSNKIFILDTNTNTVELMYEENNKTLAAEDPRACNSEIFLLATEASKLILKYHTIGTGSLCDSAWSEPTKTYFLDVKNLQNKMLFYDIPVNLTATAELEEAACRAKL